MGAHDVHSQYSTIVSMTNHLDHTSRVAQGDSPTRGSEGKLAHFVRNFAISGVLLGNANPGYLRLGKDTTRDGAIICPAGMPKGILNSYLSLIGSNMRQHVLAKNIADGINIFDICLKVFIHLDSSTVRLYTKL